MDNQQENNNNLFKEFHFVSSWGREALNFSGKVRSDITVEDKCIKLDIRPKRRNKTPVILFEDILDVKTGKSCNLFCIILAVIALLLGLFDSDWIMEGLIFCFIFIWGGLDNKATIYQRNGVNVTLFSTRFLRRTSFVNQNFEEFIKEITERRMISKSGKEIVGDENVKNPDNQQIASVEDRTDSMTQRTNMPDNPVQRSEDSIKIETPKFCVNCGSKLNEGVKFCGKCGKAI